MQVKQLLERVFPGIEVIGTTYPLSPTQQLLAQAVGAAQMAGLGMVFFGDRVCESLGVAPPPPWLANVQRNKPTAAIGVWMVGNICSGSVSSTGAFEIYYDGKLVSSCLF